MKRRFLLLICLAIALLCSHFEVIWAADAELSVSAVLGYDGYGKFGRYIPIEITIISNKEFTGSVRVIVPAAEETGNYAYEYPISLAAGEELILKREIPLISNHTLFYIEVLDRNGELQTYTEAPVITAGSQVTELYVGILSEYKEAIEAFQGVNVGEYTDSSFPFVVTRAFGLHSQSITNLPESIDGLDLLVIDAESYAKLTEMQKEAVWQWVKKGGVLIREIVKDSLTPEDREGFSEEIEVRPALWVQSKEYGEGVIGYVKVHSEETNMMEYIMDSQELSGVLIGNVCTADKITTVIESDHYYEGKEEYDSIANMLNVGIDRKLPSLWLYVLIIIIYLILAGPVLYFVLKKKDKVWLTGKTMLILSASFSVIIYILGSRTRFHEPFLRYASVWNLNGSKVYEETFFDTKSPYSKPYHLSIHPDYEIKPVSVSSHYYYEGVVDTVAVRDFQVGFYYGEEKTNITISKATPFTSKYFCITNTREESDLAGLTANITYYNELVTGKVTNNSERVIKGVILLAGEQAVIVGDIEPGASVDVKEFPVVYISPNFYREAARSISGIDWFSGNRESEEYVLLAEKTNLLEKYISMFDSEDGSCGVLLGFLDDNENKFQIGKDFQLSGVTMLYKKLNLNTSKGRFLYQNLTEREIFNIDSEASYNPKTNSTLNASVRLQYNLGDLNSLWKIRFSDRMIEEGNTYYRPFVGNVLFYNPQTLKYETIDLEKKEFYKSEIEKYLLEKDGSYYLLVQYTIDSKANRYQEVRFPLVSVIRTK